MSEGLRPGVWLSLETPGKMYVTLSVPSADHGGWIDQGSLEGPRCAWHAEEEARR